MDGKIDAVLRDRQDGLNLRLGDAVVKGQHDGVDRIVRQIQLQRLRAGEVDALIGLVPVAALLPVELEGIAEAVDELAALAQTDDAHVRCLEGDLAGADDHIAPGLDQVQIGTRQRAPQLEGRNGVCLSVGSALSVAGAVDSVPSFRAITRI